MADEDRDWVEVGVVARPHGVRGELRVHLHDAGSEALSGTESVRIGDSLYACRARRGTGAVLLALEGVADRDQAEALKGRPIAVPRDSLELAEDDVLLADMVGCRVLTPDGKELGTVHAIEAGPQDRLVVRGEREEMLVPIVSELLIEVDLEAKSLVVDVPEGMPTRHWK